VIACAVIISYLCWIETAFLCFESTFQSTLEIVNDGTVIFGIARIYSQYSGEAILVLRLQVF
jgi:hypothetical protein